jgi:two-component system response regulator VanR
MKERILVVDDEKEIADLLEVYLTNDGFQVQKF